MGVTRLVIAEDDYLVREGARAVLDGADGLEVVATAGNGAELGALLGEHDVDVVVLDIRILTAPTVQGAITDGALEISGNFTQEQAQERRLASPVGACDADPVADVDLDRDRAELEVTQASGRLVEGRDHPARAGQDAAPHR